MIQDSTCYKMLFIEVKNTMQSLPLIVCNIQINNILYLPMKILKSLDNSGYMYHNYLPIYWIPGLILWHQDLLELPRLHILQYSLTNTP